MKRKCLLGIIHEQFKKLMNNYLTHDKFKDSKISLFHNNLIRYWRLY